MVVRPERSLPDVVIRFSMSESDSPEQHYKALLKKLVRAILRNERAA